MTARPPAYTGMSCIVAQQQQTPVPTCLQKPLSQAQLCLHSGCPPMRNPQQATSASFLPAARQHPQDCSCQILLRPHAIVHRSNSCTCARNLQQALDCCSMCKGRLQPALQVLLQPEDLHIYCHCLFFSFCWEVGWESSQQAATHGLPICALHMPQAQSIALGVCTLHGKPGQSSAY